MQKEIFEYMRRKRQGKVIKVGVVVGFLDNGTIRVGWSKCNHKMGDKFNFDEGMKIAVARAMGHEMVSGNQAVTEKKPVPLCSKRQIIRFQARCVKYFQDAKEMRLVH